MRKILTLKVWNFSSFLAISKYIEKNYDYTDLWDWSKFISQVDIVVFRPADMILVWEMGCWGDTGLLFPNFRHRPANNTSVPSCSSRVLFIQDQNQHERTYNESICLLLPSFREFSLIVRSIRIKIQSVKNELPFVEARFVFVACMYLRHHQHKKFFSIGYLIIYNWIQLGVKIQIRCSTNNVS